MSRAKSTALVLPGMDLAQQWANRINRTMGEAVVATIATGQYFIDAKKQLRPRGGFLRLFAEHPEHVADPVRCTPRAAQMFMAIAQHPLLSNANHGSHLPSSWRTLYELTKLPMPVLERALADGRITPALERRDVTRLRTGGAPSKRRRSELTTPLDDHLVGFERALHRAIRGVWRRVPPADRAAIVDALDFLVNQLREEISS